MKPCARSRRARTGVALVLRAIDTFLDLCTAPALQRVLYVDGPAVLTSAVPNPAGLSLIRQSLERLMTRGYIAAQPLEALARLWFGALVAGAFSLVQAGDQPTAQADLTQRITPLLPRRWAVERPCAWLSQKRRLSKDYERLCTSESMISGALTRLMLRRRAQS